MHTDQLNIETDVVRDLIRKQFPQFENEEIVKLRTAGTVNAIFRIGSGHTARFPLQGMDANECNGSLEAEAVAMNELAEYCPFHTPRPVGIGKPDLTYPMPWFIQTWIEGETATPDALSNSRTFALDLAHLINSLRKADLRCRSFEGRGRGGDLTDHDDWMAVCFSNSEGILDVPHLRQLWSGFRELPSVGYAVMSHKDLIPANLLVRGDHLIGVLDGGAFGPADPSLDLVAGWHLLDLERRAIFRDAIGADELEWQRGAAWAFQQAIGLVWYYRETNPTMSELGRSTISRLVLDDVL